MAAFLDLCRFIASAGGTTDWTYSSTVNPYISPTVAGAVNGRVYKVRAESADLTQWEVSEGIYSSAGAGSFVRTTVLYNSSGTGTLQGGAGTKINFTLAPQVWVVASKLDLLLIEEANSFTSTQKTQAQDNLGIRRVASANVTWYVATTGNDANTGFASGITGTITFTNGSANIGWTGHGRSVGDVFFPTTTGALPTNFTSGMLYYVKAVVDPNTITVAATSGGTAITAGSIGSGTHTATHISPLLTVQKGLDLACAMDMLIYSATVRVAGGTYNQALSPKPTVGGSSFQLRGDTVTPSNVILTNNAGGWGVFYVNGPYNWSIAGFRLTASGSNSGGIFGFNGAIITAGNIEWGNCGNYHIWLNNGAYMTWGGGSMAVVASGTAYFMLLQQGGKADLRGVTLSFSTNPTAYTVFVSMNDVSDALLSGMTFTNKAFVTGQSHVLSMLSGINSGGGTETGGSRYLPGNADGTKATGSQWA